MAISVSGGHVQRAIDFYNKLGKYFIIGGTTPWDDETLPDAPTVNDFRLKDTVGYKKVDNCFLVVPDENGTISYRTQNWRIVPNLIKTQLAADVVTGNNILTVQSLAGMTVGAKLRIHNLYEGKITSINTTTNQVILDTESPAEIASGAVVLGGALVEDARYVYVDCYLNYDQFPIVTYRQIGLCTEVAPNTENVLRAAAYSASGTDEFSSVGILEVLDNRPPNTRDIDQRELLSIILEF